MGAAPWADCTLEKHIEFSQDKPLARKLHEGFGNQGVMDKAVGLIGRRSIAVAMI